MPSIYFFGTPQFAVPTLRTLISNPDIEIKGVVTQPDRVSGRGSKLVPSPVKECALEAGLKVIQCEKLKESSELLEDSKLVDGAVVVAFGKLLPSWLLNNFKRQVINVHSSLLPRWRGAAPIQRALMAGDSETGVSIMQLEEGLDTGPVYLKKSVLISNNTTYSELHDELAKIGAKLIDQSILSILSNRLNPTPQTSSGVTYADKILKEEALINWNQPASKICRLIHGLSGSLDAYTYYNQNRLKILKASYLDNPKENSCYQSGEVFKLKSSADGSIAKIAVQCDENSLLVPEIVKIQGRPQNSIAQFLNGHPQILGSILRNQQ